MKPPMSMPRNLLKPLKTIVAHKSLDDDTIRWTVDLALGGFYAEGEGTTFAAAWDEMVARADEEIADANARLKRIGVESPEPPSSMAENIRPWHEETAPLTSQEVEIIMNLRRRGATQDAYIIVLEVNAEDHPGKWSVYEKKDVSGVADTLDAAWDERF
jgi:hypothetical protein